MNSLSWVVCDGGPHLFLPLEAADKWSGTQQPSDGRSIVAIFRWSAESNAPATDYDVACDVDDLAGLVPVGNSMGLVLGDEVPMSTWVASTRFCGGMLVVPMEWPDATKNDGGLLAAVHSLPASEFAETGLTLPASSGRFLLIAAADNGPDWFYPTLQVAIAPIAYRVVTADVRTQGYWVRLHALHPAI